MYFYLLTEKNQLSNQDLCHYKSYVFFFNKKTFYKIFYKKPTCLILCKNKNNIKKHLELGKKVFSLFDKKLMIEDSSPGFLYKKYSSLENVFRRRFKHS